MKQQQQHQDAHVAGAGRSRLLPRRHSRGLHAAPAALHPHSLSLTRAPGAPASGKPCTQAQRPAARTPPSPAEGGGGASPIH